MSIIRGIKKCLWHKSYNIKRIYTIDDKRLNSNLYGVITVDNRTVGKAIVSRVKESGGNFVVIGRDKSILNEWSSLLNCPYLMMDSLSNVFEQSEKILGHPINCLVNNSCASLHQNSILEVTDSDFVKQFEINCKDAYFLIKEFLAYLLKRKSFGNILNISTTKTLMPDDLPYGSLKNSLNSLTYGVARKYSSFLRCNSLLLGPVSTMEDDNNNVVDKEVAEVANFLLSGMSACINGQLISCDNSVRK